MSRRNAFWAVVLLLALAVYPRPAAAQGMLVVVKNWIASAECARSTGAVLVVCRGNNIVPIAADSPGDDPGHALALGIYAATTGKVVTTDTISDLNSLINFEGVAALALLLLALRLRVCALFVLLSGPIIAVQFNDISPHAAQLGDACLASILPIAILGFRRSVLWVCIGLLCLAVAATFRQSIGLMGLAATFIALCISFRSERRTFAVALLLMALISYETPTLILHLRDAAYGISSEGLMQRHGIWHNLYIGLGTDPNPFGIHWNDTSGFDAAQKVNPGVGWATQAYYDTIRGEYFKILFAHPPEVANVYYAKIWDVLLSPLPDPVSSVVLLPAFLVIVALFAITGWKASRQIIAIQIVSGLFICFFAGQAVLFHYSMLYMHPIQIFLALALGVCVDAEIDRAWKPRPSVEPVAIPQLAG